MKDLLRLALETGGNPRTIRRWMNGETVNALTDYALRLACVKLKIKRRAMRVAVTKRKRSKR